MGERATNLAKRYEGAVAELTALIEESTDAQWRAICKGEGWSFGVTGHHIAEDQDGLVNWFTAIVNAAPRPQSAETLDQRTARHAAEHANCTKAETLDLLRAGTTRAARAVRALGDEQLDRSAPPAPDGRPGLTAGEVIDRILIGHVTGHMASMRAAIGL